MSPFKIRHQAFPLFLNELEDNLNFLQQRPHSFVVLARLLLGLG